VIYGLFPVELSACLKPPSRANHRLLIAY